MLTACRKRSACLRSFPRLPLFRTSGAAGTSVSLALVFFFCWLFWPAKGRCETESSGLIMPASPRQSSAVAQLTDSVGTEEANRVLSLRRAQAVKDYLVRQGVPANRLRADGLGESRPIDTNETDLGRMRNRRIEFVVVK